MTHKDITLPLHTHQPHTFSFLTAVMISVLTYNTIKLKP